MEDMKLMFEHETTTKRKSHKVHDTMFCLSLLPQFILTKLT